MTRHVRVNHFTRNVCPCPRVQAERLEGDREKFSPKQMTRQKVRILSLANSFSLLLCVSSCSLVANKKGCVFCPCWHSRDYENEKEQNKVHMSPYLKRQREK